MFSIACDKLDIFQTPRMSGCEQVCKKLNVSHTTHLIAMAAKNTFPLSDDELRAFALIYTYAPCTSGSSL